MVLIKPYAFIDLSSDNPFKTLNVAFPTYLTTYFIPTITTFNIVCLD